jgi:hypothetical protein
MEIAGSCVSCVANVANHISLVSVLTFLKVWSIALQMSVVEDEFSIGAELIDRGTPTVAMK